MFRALCRCTLTIALAGVSPLRAQSFEVASVRRAASPPAGAGVRDSARGGPGTSDPGQVTYTNLRLKDLLLTAYGLKDYQISGPGWLDSERYDIAAKIPAGTNQEEFARMLQNLLTERFKLKLHRESRELLLYELAIAKNGPGLKPAATDPNAAPAPPAVPGSPPALGTNGFPRVQPGHSATVVADGRIRLAARKVPVAKLADLLANQLGRPVVNRTGLTGDYDYTLEFSPEGLARGTSAAAAADPDVPSLPTAVQKQLGLKLERKKGPVEVLVVDHAEQTPTEN